MVSAPLNLYTARTANRAAKVRVYLGPKDGSADPMTESFDLIPLEIVRTAGSQPDYAVFEYKTDELVEDVECSSTVTGNPEEISFNRQVSVELEGRRGGIETVMTLFWGELLTETLRIDPQTQRISIVAFVADYHFGALLEGEYQFNHSDLIDATDRDLVAIDPRFNPLIDGIVEANLATHSLDNGGRFQGKPLWVDPESIRTAKAQELIGENDKVDDYPAQLWTLPIAVGALCEWLLGSELYQGVAHGGDPPEFILPPEGTIPRGYFDDEGNFIDLVLDPIWDDAPAIFNVRLPRGKHLPFYLDGMLHPNGYDWYLGHAGFSPDGTGDLPGINIFRRGRGVKKQLKLQPLGEELDPAKSNADHIAIQTDLSNLANEMRGWGSFEQKELTIELYRGWLESDDDLSVEDLRRSDPESLYNTDNKRDVWRLFVGNEAGDYTDTRDTVQPISEHRDFSDVFGLAIPKRREVDYCLTKDKFGKRRVPLVEWSDDDGVTWQEVPPGSYVILRDQIGIRFTGDTPPDELVDAGDEAKLRITCTITGDERLNSTSTPILDESPSLRTVPLFIDLSDRYHKRSVQTTGDLASTLADDENGADERDDASDLQTYLANTLEAEQSASMKCQFRLHGLQTQYEISDLITGIDGRDIYLNRNKFDPDLKAARKYVQVFGVRYLIQEQVTELIVEDVK